ncbi:MAG: YbjN domain-containing protein [Bryobacteraceae bacterium]
MRWTAFGNTLSCLLLATALCRGQVDQSQPGRTRSILKGMGFEFTEDSSNGANVFRFELDGYKVALFAGASDLRISAGFPDKLEITKVNVWNQNHRFSRAYVDESGRPFVEADLDLAGGVTGETVEAFIKRFRTTLREYGKLLPAPTLTGATIPVHKKSASATKRIKAPFGDFALWIDPAKWKQTSSDGADPVMFANNNGEGFVQIISEKGGVPTDALPEVALRNAQQADPDSKITFREKRIVNGRQVLAMRLESTVDKMALRFYGYYYGGTSGTIQVIAFALANVFDRNADEFTMFLDGLEISDQDLPSLPIDSGVLLVNSGTMAINYDPEKWKKTASGNPGSFTFKHAKGDGFAMVIAERTGIPTDAFPDIALANAQKADPKARITFREKRKVNGVEVWFLKMEGETSGVPLTYYGYYYGGTSSAIQVLTFTGRNLAGEYEKDFMDFLNGFRLIEQP